MRTRRILVAGASGQVARALAETWVADFDFLAIGRPHLDIADLDSVRRAVQHVRPAAVINAAAYTSVDKAESEPDVAFAINCDGAANLARIAAENDLPVVHLSTDYVFGGDKEGSYEEQDVPDPRSVYGASKLAGERAVATENPRHLILRTAWVYGPHGHNFLKTMLRLATERDVVRVVDDQHGTPTYAADIAAGIAVALRRALSEPNSAGWRGVFHLVAEGETSWAGFAEEIFSESAARGGPATRVERIGTADYPMPARRPSNSRLSTARFRREFGVSLPFWQSGLCRCLDAMLEPALGIAEGRRT